MVHRRHNLLERLLHYAKGLLETLAELVVDVAARPREPHHRGAWYFFWASFAGTALVGVFVYKTGVSLDFNGMYARTAALLYRFYPLWMPFLFGALFARLWLDYIRSDFLARNPGVVLELRVPQEITKTPKAMELFFMAMYETGSVEYNETYWEGKVRPWFSYEIVSFEGQVRFFVWTLPKYRNVFEAELYAQYPTVEIIEVPDYTKKKVYDPRRNYMWGTYFTLQRPDPYPIMTYVDYGLDKETEEEFKVDPLSTLLEYLGSMKKGEEVWIQILAQAYKIRGLKEGKLFKERDWAAEGQKEINKIMKRDPETKSTRQFTEAGYPIVPTLSEWEKKQVEAIERSINKRAFWCTVRLCYHAEPEAFHLRSPSTSGLLGTFRKPFNSNLLNGFKLGWYTDISDPTKDFLFLFGLKSWAMRLYIPKYATLMIDAFRRRSFFYPPYRNWKSRPYLLTTEELATMFHIPGRVVTTPTFARVPSKKVEPPANLPV